MKRRDPGGRPSGVHDVVPASAVTVQVDEAGQNKRASLSRCIRLDPQDAPRPEGDPGGARPIAAHNLAAQCRQLKTRSSDIAAKSMSL
jgi:hypothetical protein